MNTLRDVGPVEEVVALYFAGALTDEQSREFEARLAAGWPGAERHVREAEDAVRAIVSDVEAVEPPAAIKQTLLSRLRAESGPLVRFAGDGAFEQTPFPGITMRLLHVDEVRRQFSCLLKLEPGSVLPSHSHDGPEECLVLEGEFLVGTVRMRKGDYQWVEPGTDHVDQWTDTGAVVYLSAPVSLLTE